MFHRSIVEMQTGEGKTLAATLPLYLHGLLGKGCHLATVNDYLARRDAEWMGPIYKALGMTVGVVETADVAAAAAQGLRLRHHLRHGQGVRLRFSPRSAAAAAHRRRADRPAGRHVGQGPGRRRRKARPGRALLRPGRRGRQHLDRRGPHAADHQRPADRGAAAGGGVLQVERVGDRANSSRTRTTSTTTRRRPWS